MRRGVAILGMLLFELFTSAARAEQGAEPAEPQSQRFLGFGPQVGFYAGAGGVVSVGAGPVGLVLAGGYAPVFVVGNRTSDAHPTFDYYGSAQLNADVAFGPIIKKRTVSVDGLAGYRYNTVLGHGAGAGIRIALDLTRVLRVELYITPVVVFPSATDRLRDRGYPRDRDPSLPWFQGGASGALVYYP